MKSAPRTRREFVQISTLGVGATVLGLPAIGRANPTGKKVNFALAGLGSLSTNQLAPAFEKCQHARLAGIITGTPAKAAKWKEQYGIPDKNIYDYDSMVGLKDNPDIDVVYVVTPNSLHKEHTLKAARAGKHVFCEKPMANSVKDCELMIEVCKEAGVKLGVGYRCHFEPHNLECMRLAREKVFGGIKIIEASFGFRIGNPDQWRLKADLAGGGALMDVGVYALQAARYLTGEEPNRVSAIETKTDHKKFAEVDESITWQMTFPSGVIAYCSTSYNVGGINRYRAFAEKGWFGLDPAYSYSGIQGSTSKGVIKFDQIDQFAAEMDDFAACILEDRESRVSGTEGLLDMRVIEGIYQSIRESRTIEL